MRDTESKMLINIFTFMCFSNEFEEYIVDHVGLSVIFQSFSGFYGTKTSTGFTSSSGSVSHEFF